MSNGLLVDTKPDQDHVFCVDCKFSTGGNFVSTWWMRLTKSNSMNCLKSVMDNSKTDLITGKVIRPKITIHSCYTCRNSSYRCGEQGKQWVPYNKHKLFQYLKRTGGEDESA